MTRNLIFAILAVTLMMALNLHTSIELEHKEDQIESNNKLIDSLTNLNDSLIYLSDSLLRQSEIWDFGIQKKTQYLINAMIYVESRGNDSAYSASENAVGCLQIRPCMVEDVNRILKKQNKTIRYTLIDRWDRNKSIEIFHVYCAYYNLMTLEDMARAWNGGPRGADKMTTVGYWNKVKNQLQS